MPHRHLSTIVFTGFEPTTAATVITMMGDSGLPAEIRIITNMTDEPWQTRRSGLLVLGMTPETDLMKVSTLLQNRTSFWEVAVALPQVLSWYAVALLAQGAVKTIPHPEDDLAACRDELRDLLGSLGDVFTDAFGLEVSDIIQLFGEKRLDKTIRLTGAGCAGSIFMRGGNVVHSETVDEEGGMEAFGRLITLPFPEIRVHNGCLTQKVTINLPAMSCLLEGSRVHDERLEGIGAPPDAEYAQDQEQDQEQGLEDQIGDVLDGVAELDSGSDVVLDDAPGGAPEVEGGLFEHMLKDIRSPLPTRKAYDTPSDELD